MSRPVDIRVVRTDAGRAIEALLTKAWSPIDAIHVGPAPPASGPEAELAVWVDPGGEDRDRRRGEDLGDVLLRARRHCAMLANRLRNAETCRCRVCDCTRCTSRSNRARRGRPLPPPLDSQTVGYQLRLLSPNPIGAS